MHVEPSKGYREVWWRHLHLLALALCAGLAGLAQASAQIHKIVVPFPAGGPSDVIARVMAEHMGAKLGEVIIVENVVGAGGTIAPARVAKAPSDGTTILIHNNTFAAAPALYDALPYDTLDAFEPIGLINRTPLVVIGRKSLPASSGGGAIDWLRANAAKANLGHGGAGTSGHFCMALLAQSIGIKPTFVAYRGDAPAVNDLVAEQIDMICSQSTSSSPQILSGTVKAFAVTAPTRLANLPDVPTTAEIGLPDVRYAVWHGLFVPKGTPPETVRKLNTALRDALANPTVVQRFKQLGAEVVPKADQEPEALRRTLVDYIRDLGAIAARAGMKAER